MEGWGVDGGRAGRWRWRSGWVFGAWAGWMLDGWRQMLAVTRADTRAREQAGKAKQSRAGERAALGLLRRRCWQPEPDTSDTRSGRLHIEWMVCTNKYIDARVLPIFSVGGIVVTWFNYHHSRSRNASSIVSVTRRVANCWRCSLIKNPSPRSSERCASLACLLPLCFCLPSASGTPPHGPARALTRFCM